MIKLFSNGVYLINNKYIVEDCNEVNSILKNKGNYVYFIATNNAADVESKILKVIEK